MLLHPESKAVYIKLNKYRKIIEEANITASFSVSEAYHTIPLIRSYEMGNQSLNEKKFVISSNIFRYTVDWGSGPIDYLKSRYIKPIILLDSKVLSESRIKQIAEPKIVIAGMTKEIRAFFDPNGNYVPGIPTILLTCIKTDPYLLLGLINSKLISYYFHIMYDSLSLSGGYLRIGGPQISSLPIPTSRMLADKLAIKISQIVNKVITEKELDKSTDTHGLEADIDKLVYQLYELTPEEIAIIENTNK